MGRTICNDATTSGFRKIRWWPQLPVTELLI